jgi:hypothetical protein
MRIPTSRSTGQREGRGFPADTGTNRRGVHWHISAVPLPPITRNLSFMRYLSLGLTILVMILAAAVCRPALLFACPGLLLIQFYPSKPRYPSESLVLVVGTSLAFWIVSFWLLQYIKLPLSVWAYGVIAVTATWGMVRFWKVAGDRSMYCDNAEVVVLCLLVSAAALRFSFFWRWPLGPAGADMSMHGYMAALIVDHDGVPHSHYPLLPIESFGAYPAGFQTMIALISLLGDLPILRSALLMEAVTLIFLTLAFYSFLNVFWDRPTSALVAVLVTFLPRNPQDFISWGGDPTLLSLALIVMGLGLLPALRGRMSLSAQCIAALITAASVLTHLIPVIGLVYIALPIAVYMVINRYTLGRDEAKHVLRNLLCIGALSLAFMAICLSSTLAVEVSQAEIEEVKAFQRHGAGGAWGGALANAPVSIPIYLVKKLFGLPFVAIGLVGLLTLSVVRPRLAMPSVIVALTTIGLVINSMYWILPLSYALYPERTALLLLLPLSLGIAVLIAKVRDLWAAKHLVLWGMAAVTLLVAVRQNDRLFWSGFIPFTLVTESDLQAMRWIQQHTPPDAVFQNRYGDAGLWIPAIAFRAITDPHLNPFYFDEFRKRSQQYRAAYVYVGKKRVYGNAVSANEFESRQDLYQKVYDRDGVVIYQHRDQASKDAERLPIVLAP